MPCIAVAGSYGFNASTTMVNHKLKGCDTVTPQMIHLSKNRLMGGCGVRTVMPSVLVTGRDTLRSHAAVIDSEVKRDHAVTTNLVQL